MKIGIVSTFNVECGISTYTEHLTQYYPKDVIIFANKLSFLTDTKISKKHKIIRCWTRDGDYRELIHEILNSGVELIHFQHEYGLFQNNQAFFEMLQVLKKRNIKIVITYHTVGLQLNTEMDRILRCFMPFVDHIIVHQKGAKDVLGVKNCTIINHGSVKVQPNSCEESRRYLNIPNDRIVCTCIGFISPNKGQMEAMMAIMKLKNEFPNIMLLIAGMPVVHGSNYTNLEYCLNLFRGVKRMNAFDYIKIIPSFIKESDLDYYAGATDIFIVNHGQTNYSISGISHLIMSYGKASVSSRSNILEDLDDTRSLKFNIGDVNQLQDSIKTLINNKELKDKLSANALDFSKKTNWRVIANKHLKLYKQI